MCLVPGCRNKSFRCKSGVCLHQDAVGDGQLDCLDGEDEAPQHKGEDLDLNQAENSHCY